MDKMNFKNTPSERFYFFFDEKKTSKELTDNVIAEKFGKYTGNPGVFLRNIKDGKNSVTVEMIMLAQQHFGLNPGSLFYNAPQSSDNNNNVMDEPEAMMYADGNIKIMMDIIASQQATIAQLVSNKKPASKQRSGSSIAVG